MQLSFYISVAVISVTLNTGRRATDGLNRFVRRTRRLEPTGDIKAPDGVAGRKIRQLIATSS